MELYRRVRPTELDLVIGQDQARAMLAAKLGSPEGLPHIVLLTGPTGTGKTTLAYILARHVGMTNPQANFTEINAADVRGIDSIREIAGIMDMAPMGGRARVWLFDEIVQWPKATQQASLTYLEKCPPHVWIFFCASDTSGLLPTFLGRCFTVQLRALDIPSLMEIIQSALNTLNQGCSISVIRTIAGKSDGSARKALQLLEAVLTTESEQEQLEIVGLASIKEEEKVEFLARLFMQKSSWPSIVKTLDSIKDSDMEGVRRQLLAYMTKVLSGTNLGNCQLAKSIIENFRFSWSEVGRAGMYVAAWDCRKSQ